MTEGEFTGYQVVVTGAGRGIGRAIAIRFAGQGAAVALVARSRHELNAVAAQITAAGGTAWPVVADLSMPGAAQAAVICAADRLGGVDILVNNAGGWGSDPGAVGPARSATESGFDLVFALNVRAALFAATTAADIMIEQGRGGAILNLSSIDGLFPAPGEALYGAAKAALINLTATLAYEWGSHRIRVNAVAPAVVQTDLTAPWLADERARAERAALYPLGRVGQPEDVAAAALFLCSPQAGWISGITLPVNGGQQATGDAFRWPLAHYRGPDDGCG